MDLPDFQTLMRPVLDEHTHHDEVRRAELRNRLAERFDLSDEQRHLMLPSGQLRYFDSRVNWAVTYLVKAGCLERTGRGVTRLTERGQQVLGDNHERIDRSVLLQFPEFGEFVGSTSKGTDTPPAPSGPEHAPSTPSETATPEEALQAAWAELQATLADDLRERLTQVAPEQFEQIVVDLLLAMGYGGSRTEAGERLGRVADGGIDGVIREDRLGLDAIYIQAKRWQPHHAVGRPDVQAFVGALQGRRASKGVFLTTARFSDEARRYAADIGNHIVLVDGQHLAQLMIEHHVGVSTRHTYPVKRIDEDFFLDLE
ncbi:restriction endonuclease [Egibacter rhizosphaerae]|uniref:Restriction endonuclease n=1 Tax=Egibacter rhizosphaerae TaxID=1670831 RepID=A0A411YID4_9ACTN|nr:restriction endonuclease [Egibacter rhizosphaerae]QBI21028.1 restriction endonuclease [Egibacter rhizosphaerae]